MSAHPQKEDLDTFVAHEEDGILILFQEANYFSVKSIESFYTIYCAGSSKLGLYCESEESN